MSIRHILLVDDHAINLDLIETFLSHAGYAVTVAKSGAMAVQRAGEQTFDLILMDVRMPKMDGLEATRLIRQLPAPYGQVPIYALTAYTFIGSERACLDAGMDGYLIKPVLYETLITAIDSLLRPGPRS